MQSLLDKNHGVDRKRDGSIVWASILALLRSKIGGPWPKGEHPGWIFQRRPRPTTGYRTRSNDDEI